VIESSEKKKVESKEHKKPTKEHKVPALVPAKPKPKPKPKECKEKPEELKVPAKEHKEKKDSKPVKQGLDNKLKTLKTTFEKKIQDEAKMDPDPRICRICRTGTMDELRKHCERKEFKGKAEINKRNAVKT